MCKYVFMYLHVFRTPYKHRADGQQATEKAKKLEAEGKKEEAKATLIHNKLRACTPANDSFVF